MSDHRNHGRCPVIDHEGAEVEGTESIWSNGVCNVDLVQHTLTSQISPRIELLSEQFEQAKTSDGISDFLQDVEQAPQPPRLVGKQSAIRSAVLPLVSDVWNGMEPMNYHVEIQVGFPPTTFKVELDSGSSLLWLQSTMNTDAKIDGQRMYDPQKSETVKYPQELLPSKRHSFRYGDGDTLEFYLLQDRIGIGNLIADLQSLGAVPPDGMKPSFRKSKAEGILGLGYPALSTELPEYTNLVLTLAKERMLKYASFSLIGPRNDPKLAAEIDKNKITQPRGSFVVGAVEKSFYQGEIAWCKSLMTERSQWIVKLDQVLINNVVVFENQLALIDTNTAYIVTSHENYRTVKEEIPGSEPILGDRMFKYPPSSLQSISFVFGGLYAPRKFRLNRQDFSLGREDHGGKACSSIVRTQGNWGFGENFWVLGGIFLDNLVTIFDYETKEIGFADIPDEEFHGEEWQKAKLSPPVL